MLHNNPIWKMQLLNKFKTIYSTYLFFPDFSLERNGSGASYSIGSLPNVVGLENDKPGGGCFLQQLPIYSA